jgi:hypothetical protein
MTDIRKWRERRDQIARYRLLAQEETTEPLAALLRQDIVSELEADLNELTENALWSPKRRPA